MFAENQPRAILGAPWRAGGGGFGEPRAVVGGVWAGPPEGLGLCPYLPAPAPRDSALMPGALEVWAEV